MPRKVKDPIVPVMQYFETASVESAKTALEVVTEIVRRRSTTKVVVRHTTKVELGGLGQPPPVEVTPADTPKARVRKPKVEPPSSPLPSRAEQSLSLPGTVATVGE